MKGREQRHFPEKNEASTHIDQRFHYKRSLWRKKVPNESNVGAPGPLMEVEPPSWHGKLVYPIQELAQVSHCPDRSRMRNSMGRRECLMHPQALWLCLPNLTFGSGPVSYVSVHVMLMLVYFTWTELSHKLGVRRTLGSSASAFCSILKNCQTFIS